MENSSYSISKIHQIIGGELHTDKTEQSIIKELLIDSRKLINAEKSLFFALISKRNDGHKYIKSLYKRGVRNFVVQQLPEQKEYLQKASYIVVSNTLQALQNLSSFHRLQMNYPVIGITGSNGKTIVKEWIYQALQADKNIVRSPKSFNSQIGVPLSVWQMKAEHHLAIFEAGISEPDEMDKLQKIIQPEIGIITNIGEAHGENFINPNHKAGEKLKLFTRVKTLIYSPDQKNIQEILIRSELLEQINSLTWSLEQDADLRVIKVEKSSKTTSITALYKEKEISIEIPFTDDASFENIMHIWCLMLYMNYEQTTIQERLLNLNPVAMRLELKEGINNCSIINDSYNSDLNSLKIAIDFLNQQNQQSKKTLILSDILQSSMNEMDLYSEIGELIAKKNISKFIGIGTAIRKQADKFHVEKYFFQDTKDFLEHYSFTSFKNETILLKGARYFEFEHISKALQQQTHQTVLEINLDHMVSNLNYFKSKLHKDTKLMVMVKAFSYGSGSYEIANLMQYYRADYLAVAYADEGVELRKAGISSPIMVMSPDEENLDTLLKYDLEPEIYSFRILKALGRAIKSAILPKNKPVKIHIKLDTGMHRLGFEQNDIEELSKEIKANGQIHIQSIFSHLAASDTPQHNDFTHEQVALFRSMADEIQSSFNHSIIKHILNSAGILQFPEYQMDMVRLGMGLYGFSNIDKEQDKLLNINKLKTTITQIKHIKANNSVGYNRSYIAKRDTTIATIPIGYADGIHRFLGNGHYEMKIRGKAAKTIGDICMDMCMLDISHIDCKEGDDVVIFENQEEINQIARTGNTIAYEVLTGISQRVKRIYFKE